MPTFRLRRPPNRVLLHNATRVGRNPTFRAYSLLLTCLHAYMLTCLHAYMLTYLHVYVLAWLHACMLERWHDTCLPPTSTAHMRGIFDFSLPPTSTAQTQALLGSHDIEDYL